MQPKLISKDNEKKIPFFYQENLSYSNGSNIKTVLYFHLPVNKEKNKF